MSGPDIEARIRAVQEQDRLVQQLRDSGQAAQADRLQETYHAREMAALAADVYEAARKDGESPMGWVRASADPESLRKAGITLTDTELKEMLHPKDSGFRAEIYVPDKRVFGEDAKPVLVFKGSTGEILDAAAPDGRRESGAEDFLNNGRQGLGMRSDYYDRAMELAAVLDRRSGSRFEIAGHSLGGGMASAASAVTGARTTTFNAAGLHPQTAERFGKENGLPLFNTRQTVQTYEVGGEVLNDAQKGLGSLSERQRAQFGLLANETGQLLSQPLMQSFVKEKLQAALPQNTHAAAVEMIDRLATQPGRDALRDVPLATGRAEILEAKMRDAQGQLVDRPRSAAPSQVAELGGPLANVLVAGAQGMRAGRVAGEQIERAGVGVAKTLDLTGDAVGYVATKQGEVAGKFVEGGTLALRTGVQGGATVVAQGRELTGMVEATLHRVRGQAASGPLSAMAWGADLAGLDQAARNLRQSADRIESAQEARARQASREAGEDAAGLRASGQRLADDIDRKGQWVAGGLRDGYATAGAYVDSGYDWAAQQVRGVTSHAPAVLSTAGGGVAALGTATASHVPTVGNPENLVNLAKTSSLFNQLGPAFGEATQRHGMNETMIPSLDAEVVRQETEARKLLSTRQEQTQQAVPAGAERTTASTPGINQPQHPDYPLFRGAQAGVHGIDASYNRTPDLRSDQLAGALAAQAKREGLQSIEQVVLSNDRTHAFAVDTSDLSSVHRRHAHVEVATGMQQPLSVSTAQVDEVNRQQEQRSVSQLSANLAAEQQEQENQQHARRMV